MAKVWWGCGRDVKVEGSVVLKAGGDLVSEGVKEDGRTFQDFIVFASGLIGPPTSGEFAGTSLRR